MASLFSKLVGSTLQPTVILALEASGNMRRETLKACSAMGHPKGKGSCLFSDIPDTVTPWFPSMIALLRTPLILLCRESPHTKLLMERQEEWGIGKACSPGGNESSFGTKLLT